MEWRKDRGSWTRGAWEGLCAYVLLHVSIAAMALFAISGAPPPRTPVLVVLTIGGPWESGDSAVPVPGVAPRRTAGAVSPEPPAAVHAPFSPPVPAPAPATEARPAQPVEAAPVLPAHAATTPAGVARASSAPASGVSGTSPDVGVPGTAHSGATTSRALPGTGTGTGEAGEMRGKGAGSGQSLSSRLVAWNTSAYRPAVIVIMNTGRPMATRRKMTLQEAQDRLNEAHARLNRWLIEHSDLVVPEEYMKPVSEWSRRVADLEKKEAKRR